SIDRLTDAVREKLDIELQVLGPVEASSADADESVPVPEIDEHDLQITWAGFHPQSTAAARVRSLVLSLTDFPTAAEPEGRKLVRECFLAAGSPVAIRVDLSAAGEADLDAALAAIDTAAETAGVAPVHVVGA